MQTTFKTLTLSSLLLASLGYAQLSAAQGPVAEARAILAKAKAGTGGAAWDAMTSVQVESAVEMAGAKGRYVLKAALAPIPRHAARIELGPMQIAFGWDGEAGWNMDPKGQLKLMTSEKAIAERRSAVYADLAGYFRADQLGAAVNYVGQREDGKDRYEIVSVTPPGGAPFELWINQESQKIERQVAVNSHPKRVQYFSDFRPVGGLVLPHLVRTVLADGKETELDRSVILRYEINPKLNDADLARPTQR